ncbi:DUF6101 family protein [Breoghania sp.]|uniref:DUF6101 family protein n=1 Tax=Breoghania sp. TaxID=2065378 RepID=UPI0026289E8E|nr:DUF6101 family protein [Breoghania sp.]MDJ0930250.1 DUF6101 family protein [Breoghania sp.]
MDPLALPSTFTVGLAAGEGGLAGADIHLEHGTVIVTRRQNGQRNQIFLKLRDYVGVAARATAIDVPGGIEVRLELVHAEPSLSLVLMEAGDLGNVVADWQAWARRLALPLLMIEPDDSLHEIAGSPNRITVGRPCPRRRSSVLRGRRPRFFVRRKAGIAGLMPVHDNEREIIARS